MIQADYVFQKCAGYGSKSLHNISKRMVKQHKKQLLYWDKNFLPKGFPKITGFPVFSYETSRPYSIHTRNGPLTKIKFAPKNCYYGKIINYPFERWGAPQIKIIGAKGTGKSVLLNLTSALWASKDVHILMFNDRRMEIRSLAAHGYFDEHNMFHPFEIDIFIPKGYQFKEANPLWEYYPNVHKKEFTHVDQILEALAPKKFVVVHEEVFTEESKLRLWNDLMENIAEYTDASKFYGFVHHELSRLIPETPSEEVNKLVKRSSNNLANFRKDRIGLLTSFHMNSEVFYRVVQKIGITIQKQPVDRNRYTRLEKEALSYTKQDFAIKREGRGWMKHTMGLFPELPDIFRMVPTRKKLIYPTFEYEEEETSSPQDKELTVKDMAYDVYPDLYRQHRDIQRATIELLKIYPDIRIDDLVALNGLGHRANTSLKGKANMELLNQEKSSQVSV